MGGRLGMIEFVFGIVGFAARSGVKRVVSRSASIVGSCRSPSGSKITPGPEAAY
jgi:hypothetical protein